MFKIRHLITKMCGQFGVRVPEVVAELLSLASSAQVEESPSEDEGQENDYDLSDQVSIWLLFTRTGCFIPLM